MCTTSTSWWTCRSITLTDIYTHWKTRSSFCFSLASHTGFLLVCHFGCMCDLWSWLEVFFDGISCFHSLLPSFTIRMKKSSLFAFLCEYPSFFTFFLGKIAEWITDLFYFSSLPLVFLLVLHLFRTMHLFAFLIGWEFNEWKRVLTRHLTSSRLFERQPLKGPKGQAFIITCADAILLFIHYFHYHITSFLFRVAPFYVVLSSFIPSSYIFYDSTVPRKRIGFSARHGIIILALLDPHCRQRLFCQRKVCRQSEGKKCMQKADPNTYCTLYSSPPDEYSTNMKQLIALCSFLSSVLRRRKGLCLCFCNVFCLVRGQLMPCRFRIIESQ